ncbi:hypothetical protein [Nocardia sp. XZ_19_369]|uniref:hypothetical protein n=1 Tax=Nocardia sp. XZ_19_369 TaxID=2769487 RepID=UPI0018907B47|nr:hypothetical protein [Nocardia sp. XZ_19_369]
MFWRLFSLFRKSFSSFEPGSGGGQLLTEADLMGTETEPRPLRYMPDYPCTVCNAFPSQGTIHFRNPDTHYELWVYRLQCPAGHHWQVKTDGG